MSRQVRMVVRGLIDKITPLLNVDGSNPFRAIPAWVWVADEWPPPNDILFRFFLNPRVEPPPTPGPYFGSIQRLEDGRGSAIINIGTGLRLPRRQQFGAADVQ